MNCILSLKGVTKKIKLGRKEKKEALRNRVGDMM